MKRSVTAAAALLALAGMGMSATAPAAEGFYIGGSALQSRFDQDTFEDDVDDLDREDLGWRLVAGFRPLSWFAMEANYTDFGKADGMGNAPSVPFEAAAKSWSAFGVGIMPVGPIELYAKAGLARIDTKSTSVLFEDEATEFAYGAGIQLALGNLGIRAEYEKIDTDVIGDLDVISLGLTFTLGGGG